ncbi:MAG: PspC domain-containing protein [Geodermatophilaceae bacterium]|jgi:phage shock protein PspC (stress-responsive transcriptional regulator)|nr:PspC domain-containing protein [Geodermatophilaceae bacterium]
MANNTLARNTSNKVIAGVCSGIARRLGLSPTVVRAVFVVSIVLPGPQVFLYLILWLLLPADRMASP